MGEAASGVVSISQMSISEGVSSARPNAFAADDQAALYAACEASEATQSSSPLAPSPAPVSCSALQPARTSAAAAPRASPPSARFFEIRCM